MKDSAWIAFSIDRDSPTPVFAQVYAAIRERIVAAELSEGSRLPPSRSLAVELGLSRSTVIAAYEQLVAEGYAEGRRGSGYYVCPIGEVELAPPCAAAQTPAREAAPRTPRTFQPGIPDMRLFPYRQWARCVARVARNAPEALVTLSDPFGDHRLRAAISAHVAEWRGVRAAPERILVTAGSGDALEICIRALTRPGQRIGLEDPGYPPLRAFVESLGLRPQWLGIDAAGAELPSAGGRSLPPKLVVLTPSHQYPLGGTMGPGRRKAFLGWAESSGGRIIEDDYDSEFRYAGRPIPALAGFDRAARTIYVGSFAKIFSNSLRLGYVVLPEDLVPSFAETLARYGTKASVTPQRALAAFLLDGEFTRHIRRVRRIYNERRKALLQALRRELPGLPELVDHQAGMQIVLNLPPSCDDQAISRQAAMNGVIAPALSTYYARGQAAPGLLLGFCAFTEAEIARGVATLRASIAPQL
jgi:GntR family transcriptional regulator/MocR family aminotransferase